MSRILGFSLIALLSFGCGQRSNAPAQSNGQTPTTTDATPGPAPTRADAAATPATTAEPDPHAPLGPPMNDEQRAATVRCQKRSDCVLVHGVCGGWDPANQENAAKVSARNQQMAARARCAPSKTPPSSPDCAAGVCRVVTHEWPELRACETPTDCVALEGVCSAWEAAAKTHESDMAQRIAKQAAAARCANAQLEPRPTPVCRERFCVPY